MLAEETSGRTPSPTSADEQNTSIPIDRVPPLFLEDEWTSSTPEPNLGLPELVQQPPKVSETPPLDILSHVFGYDTFRPNQREIIDSILARRDTLAIMPTGGGKSLCYQLPALLFDGLTVVISPLISLMQDQVRQLDALGIPAAILNSSLDRQDYAKNQRRVVQGEAKLLYLAPETLFQPRTQQLLRQTRVACITIDEAHCISEWGHDFRPEYRRIVEIREAFPHAVCVALTATATPRVRNDIARVLGMHQSSQFIASFDRPNLRLEVTERDRPIDQVLRFLQLTEGASGIVYCSTRKRVEEVATQLKRHGLNTRPYHAGLDEEVRRKNQDDFIRDDVDIIVATVAFGMGINKPDIRWVIHHDIPKSVEGYYQEIGRAGRDGLPARCLLLYSPADLRTIEYFIAQKDESEQRVARFQLQQMVAYAESHICRRRPLLAYFGESYAPSTCSECDNCLNPKKLVDITVEAQKFLSCVYRTGQRYGAHYVSDVLRGSKAQKVVQQGHDKVSTHGIGKDKDARQWKHIARQLVQLELLHQDTNYGTLQLTESAGAVLRGETQVQGIIRPAKSPVNEPRKRSRSRSILLEGADEGLFQALRRTRKNLADEKGVPPYVIFTDKSLIAMASEQPTTLEAMGKLHGIGRIKRIRYGPIFLEAIGEYLGTAVDLGPEPKRAKPTAHSRSQGVPKRTAAIIAALLTGQSVHDVAEAHGLTLKATLKHIRRFMDSGGQLDERTLRQASGIDEDMFNEALTLMEAHGGAHLQQIYESLDARIDHEVLEIIRLVHDLG